MDTDAMIYIPSFINMGSGIQNLIWGDIENMKIAQAYFYFLKVRKLS
jgi:hypothetical protein